uniref:Probable G-protein coupled receptor 83-like n=1 Tax=Saccoglossus kowalevskii TaxID=10224 RepID=A0ABM0GNI3_SACKO|nr:PREDICTED: probable G-protein coupled receptor 83-like [Saccoglossus kowalevskii]
MKNFSQINTTTEVPYLNVSGVSDFTSDEPSYAEETATETSTEVDDSYSYDYSWDIDVPDSVYIVVLGIASVLIVVGNLLVIIAVFKQPKLRRSATNLFIVSLAFSDLLIGLCVGPMELIRIMGSRLLVTVEALCDIPGVLQYTSICTTIFTLVAIGADRYRAIVQPMKPRVSVHKARVCIVGIWVLGFVYAAYRFPVHGVTFWYGKTENDSRLYFCEVLPQMHFIEIPMTVVHLVVLYIVPLITLTYLYGRMIVTLYGGTSINDESKRRKKRAVKMLLLVVVMFALSWLPYRVHAVLYFYDESWFTDSWFIYSIFYFAYLSNSFVNPIIYAAFSASFRREFVTILTCGLHEALVKRRRRGVELLQTPKSQSGSTVTGMTQVTGTGSSVYRSENSMAMESIKREDAVKNKHVVMEMEGSSVCERQDESSNFESQLHQTIKPENISYDNTCFTQTEDQHVLGTITEETGNSEQHVDYTHQTISSKTMTNCSTQTSLE